MVMTYARCLYWLACRVTKVSSVRSLSSIFRADDILGSKNGLKRPKGVVRLLATGCVRGRSRCTSFEIVNSLYMGERLKVFGGAPGGT